jgi:hypothetical protein
MIVRGKRKIAAKAPTKLSAAVTMALRDMSKIEKSDTLKINMNEWHVPRTKTNCSVCMAGAVMHYKAKLDHDAVISGVGEFSEEWRDVFNALDCFRSNNIEGALDYLGVRSLAGCAAERDIIVNTTHVEYAESPAKFRVWAKAAAKILKERGL